MSQVPHYTKWAVCILLCFLFFGERNDDIAALVLVK